MDQEETYTWEPLKKSHPVFNSLVLKIVVSLGISFYSFATSSDYMLSYLYGGDNLLLVCSALLVALLILVLLSVAEALVMAVISMVQWVIIRLRRVLEVK